MFLFPDRCSLDYDNNHFQHPHLQSVDVIFDEDEDDCVPSSTDDSGQAKAAAETSTANIAHAHNPHQSPAKCSSNLVKHLSKSASELSCRDCTTESPHGSPQRAKSAANPAVAGVIQRTHGFFSTLKVNI